MREGQGGYPSNSHSWIAPTDHGTNTAYVYKRKTLSHCVSLRVLLYSDLSSIVLRQGVFLIEDLAQL